jgi:hypothetical protein
MNSQIGSPDERNNRATDAALDRALKNFRSSVHAWGQAEYGKPRTVSPVRYTSWRMAAGWALGCVLAAGSVTGGLYEFHHRQQVAAIAAAEAVRQQKLAEQQNALKENEDLLAKVNSDVSRQVPSAMEPLAQLMDVDEAQ